MITLKKTGKIFIAIMILTGIISCDDDKDTIAFKVVGDVFVVKRKIDDETKFANAYYAYGTHSMSLAKVTTPDGTAIQLNPLGDQANTYQVEPKMNDYATDLPEPGNYTFDVINEDIPHQAIDLLEFDNIDYPTITSTEYNNASQTLTVEWETVEQADKYVVKMANNVGVIVYDVGQLLPNTMTSFQIDPNVGNWTEEPIIGTSYTVEVYAYLYENGTDADDFKFHIQEISVGEKEIVWGE
ncbi:MAG: hypothetical protein ABFS16_11860 [Bacteroidota bacterium]